MEMNEYIKRSSPFIGYLFGLELLAVYKDETATENVNRNAKNFRSGFVLLTSESAK